MKTIQAPFPELNTLPKFIAEASFLVQQLRNYNPEELASLMNVSSKIATLNFERYSSWGEKHISSNASQALLSYSGEVFNGLQASTLSKSGFEFATQHMAILSGLYGVVYAGDLVQPYRLEIGLKWKTKAFRNLYLYWEETISKTIEHHTGTSESQTLINLASNEYFKAIKPKNFPFQVITPRFLEWKGDAYKMVTIYAKKARGMMLRYILENNITDPEYLKGFEDGGYMFDPARSGELEYVFCRR